MVRVKVLFFGVLKDIVGSAGEELDLEPGAPAGAVFEHYAGRFPRLRELERSILVAHNQRFSSRSEPLAEGDEVALMPPVSGGSSPYTEVIENDAGVFALTRQTIEFRNLAAALTRGEDGALVAFQGLARNNTNGRATLFLDYDCYEAMAVRVMAEIGADLTRSHPIGRVAMVHRLGRVDIGETSVVILVAAPHRRPAFEAAMEGIDRLKRTVPIWKKEHFADGEVWVEGEWDRSVAQS
jgi:molybdopterin synthase catalytic subunit/molybdopterin converting factor small subunit